MDDPDKLGAFVIMAYELTAKQLKDLAHLAGPSFALLAVVD